MLRKRRGSDRDALSLVMTIFVMGYPVFAVTPRLHHLLSNKKRAYKKLQADFLNNTIDKTIAYFIQTIP